MVMTVSNPFGFLVKLISRCRRSPSFQLSVSAPSQSICKKIYTPLTLSLSFGHRRERERAGKCFVQFFHHPHQGKTPTTRLGKLNDTVIVNINKQNNADVVTSSSIQQVIFLLVDPSLFIHSCFFSRYLAFGICVSPKNSSCVPNRRMFSLQMF
jgi:hypothetical protein